ncbi:1-phosphatidylinositol 3-phosphate 5-kinase [Venturia canescens]|uniref:1-phosphatidylinositol 3-phosphate 5-kinase n=1 Tax=Venturia canescens TaxID=32260 RepID=UPI001C9C8743|nr:1-phosphatidylinositol 3-phosphate 5-kinase [Venturia canescens]
MNKNMNSPTKLTEFAPLSPVESSQPVVASLFSKLFGFGRSSSIESASTLPPSKTHSNNEEGSPMGDSESWNETDEKDKDDESTTEEESPGSVNYSLDASEGRSLPNVLKRISNIVALRSGNLKSYKDSQLRSYWMPDSVAKQCYECGERFTTFRRRHHCRVCGQIFCWKCCSDEIPGKTMGCIGDLRACTYCRKVAFSYLQSSDMNNVLSADLQVLPEDLRTKYATDSQPQRQRRTSDDPLDDETRAYRKASVGYMEEKYALGRSSSSYLGTQGRSLILKNSAPLRMIYEELFRSSRAIQLQTHRVRLKSYYNCFIGNELVNWLVAHNKTATRAQAIAIAQALLEAGFIESVQSEESFGDGAGLFKPANLSLMQSLELSDENRSHCDSQEPAWVTNIPQHDSTTDSESDTKQPIFPGAVGRLPSSSSSFYLDLNVEASTATLKRPTSEDLASIMTESSTTDGTIEQKEVTDVKSSHNCESGVSDELLSDTLQVQKLNERNSWHKAKNLSTANEEFSCYNSLTAAYKKHEHSLIRQLLKREGLSDNWTEPIISLAHQIIDQVRPDLHHDAEDMDIRQYVQIKKSPGASKNDCEIVSGVVCSKNVAHRGMDAMMAHPKILLLQCGLMYQRGEGKLLSLEPVMLAENEHLGNTVARITALGPDVVLVHRSVSRLAQDRFRECGVTLVLNVKLSVLERVARCTGGTIVNTVDGHLTTRYKLGTCKKFYLRNFPTETNRPKTLMYFEGCPNAHLGATILLRGGSQAELKRVKNVTSTMIFAAYSWRLEKSFLMDEFARPPLQSDDSFLDESASGRAPQAATIDEEAKNLPGKSRGIEEPRSIFDDSPPGKVSETNIVVKKSMSVVRGDENGSGDCSMTVETFKRVSGILDEDSDPYDTLKLFKARPKSTLEETNDRESSKNSESSSGSGCESEKPQNPELKRSVSENSEAKWKSVEKMVSEEKRAHGESVSDLSDPLHQYLREETDEDRMEKILNEFSDAESAEGQDKNSSAILSVAEMPLSNKFKKALDDAILSYSPYLKFTIPYLETLPGRNCALRQYFPNEIYFSSHFLDKPEGSRGLASSSESSRAPAERELRLKPEHPFVKAKLTSPIENRSVQSLLANFRACGSRLYPQESVIREPVDTEPKEASASVQKPRKTSSDCLEPENHQRLSVFFCSFSHARTDAPVFCVNPWVVNMDLYGRNDIALGAFLERYCLTNQYKCPAQSCRAEIAQHARRFAHEDACLHITLNALTTQPFRQENSEDIFMWSKCNRCQSVSPVVPMSSDTWSLSFAKYLELRFHAGIYTKRGNECRHSLHHEHSQYFTKKSMLAVFRYAKISQWEISLPPAVVRGRYDAKQHANVIEEVKSLALKGDEVFSSIRDKLNSVQPEPEGLNSTKQQLAKEQQYLKNKIEEIQLKITSPTLENKKFAGKNAEKQVQFLMFRIEDGIVISKRLICEAVNTWNSRIQEMMTSSIASGATAALKKREERTKRFAERSVTSGGSNNAIFDADGYITEDTASESQLEDLSPISADYNAVDAVQAHTDLVTCCDNLDSSDNELNEANHNPNPDDILVVQESPPKFHHQRSHSDVFPLTAEDVAPDRKKKKKTILEQLLPSAGNAHSIANPLPPSEHHSLPLGSVVPMVVYESEPSSIIAYALDSHDYKHALAEIVPSSRGVPEVNSSPLNRRKLPENRENFGPDPPTQATSQQQPIPGSGDFKRPLVLSFLRGNSPSPASPLEATEKSIVSGESSSVNNAPSANSEIEDPDKKSIIKQQTYIEVQFHDSTTNFYCRIYFAAQFAALRENVLPCGEEGFTRSLCRSVQWAARGGKSGSAFCKTRDDRFILKELSRLELQIFLDFAPNYFAYMEKCQRTKQPTLLGKIVGVYRVSFKNNTTNAALRTSVLVMENLFYGRTITDKFDLKGSVRNRLVNPEEADSEGELVLLDENLLNMSCDSPLYIKSHSKAVLNKAIEQDTKFLADNSVMDYSLLVGLEPNSNQLVLGVIDYIRTFTWDKKLETMVKKSGILGGQGKLPTIVSPEEYRARFIAAMDLYFLPVPDRWTCLGRSVESTL